MSALLVLPTTSSGPLARRNPSAKLAAATVPGLVLVLSLDVVTPSLVLLATVLALPLSGVPTRLVVRRSRPLLLAAVAVGCVNAVFGSTRTGEVLFGPVTTGSALTGLAIALRVLALALPGVLVLASTDPVDLADSLVQQLRAPARFAYGTLAALRLLPMLGQEWQSISWARRARGLDAGRSPVAALRLFAGQVLGLLVVAIRRGTRLAAAMDARGFDSAGPRTAARVQRLAAADIGLVVGVAALSAAAAGVSLALGTWRPLL